MVWTVKQLEGFEIAARDGTIGKVREVYFDDRHWVIRHLVVDTGGWLSGRLVLVSPHAVERFERDRRVLGVALTREQVENAPGVDTDKPVSRQHESAVYDYYGYPYYWSGSGLWGASALPLGAGPMAVPPPLREGDMPTEVSERRAAERASGDPALRSSREVVGYHIAATDGTIGHVDDLLFDERSWQIGDVVVDTRNWLPGRRVLIAPLSIEHIDWGAREARVRQSRDEVKASAPYDPARIA